METTKIYIGKRIDSVYEKILELGIKENTDRCSKIETIHELHRLLQTDFAKEVLLGTTIEGAIKIDSRKRKRTE